MKQSIDARSEEDHAVVRLANWRRLKGGSFLMGSDRHYPEEAPAHWEQVEGFEIQDTPVTNVMFAEFIACTGYVTQAERPLRPEDYPGVPPAQLQPASLVFIPPTVPVLLDDVSRWWSLVPGADWSHPQGPGSNLRNMDNHPVVHVGLEDAMAYAQWAGCDLPTEQEWEYAAWGGHQASEYVWGHELVSDGQYQANTWQGAFPNENLQADGFAGTSPVKTFPGNGFGLFDMIGNVWEWTTSIFQPTHDAPQKSCCTNAKISAGMKVLKGGSHLCAPNYCQRYRAPARSPQSVDTTSSHIGFRCVRR